MTGVVDEDDFDAWLKENIPSGAIQTYDKKIAAVDGHNITLHAEVKGLFFEEQRKFVGRARAWTTDESGNGISVQNLTASIKVNGQVISKRSLGNTAIVTTGIVEKQTKDNTPPSASGYGSSVTPVLDVETEELFTAAH